MAGKFEHKDISGLKFLVTGGAGFIGSNLVEYLISHNAGLVRVLDNLSTGNAENLNEYKAKGNFEFIQSDLNDEEVLNNAVEGIDYVLHQAALGSVIRSIENPLASHEANITGTLRLFESCKKHNVKRVVFASSSSVYGDWKEYPMVEDKIGNQLSPYAVTKLMMEKYGFVYGNLHGLETIGLRYFNVFGPRQSPDGAYAAVVPRFIDSIVKGEAPHIHGDGEQSRDFTFIGNVVEANVCAMFSEEEGCAGQVYNIALGDSTSVNELFSTIKETIGSDVEPNYTEKRPGDIRHSHANIDKARRLLGFDPSVTIKDGLIKTVEWFRVNRPVN